MLFAIYYDEMTPERRDEVLKRFQKFGDAAPKGMKVVGNWLSVTLLEGWSIVEATTRRPRQTLPILDRPQRQSHHAGLRRRLPRTASSQPTRSNRRAAPTLRWKATTHRVERPRFKSANSP